MDWGSLIGSAISLFGQFKSAKGSADQAAMYNNAWQVVAAVTPPSLQALTIALMHEVVQGTMTPEMATAQLQESTAMAGVQIPQELLDAQYMALNQIKDVVQSGGLTDIDKAKINDIKTELATWARGQRDATKQSFAQRGLAGSGMELLQQQMANQSSAESGYKQGMDVGRLAAERSLQAMGQLGNLSSSMRGQDFAEQAAKAQAEDQRLRFNAQMRQQTEQSNVASRNAAQLANLQNAQGVAARNTQNDLAVALANQKSTAGDYESRLRQATAVASGQLAGAKGMGEANKQETAAYGAIGQSIPDITKGVGDAYEWWKKKTNTGTGGYEGPGNYDYSGGGVYLNKGTSYVDGPSGNDQVKAHLTRGEAVLNTDAANAVGRDNIDALNSQQMSDDEIDNLLNELTGNRYNRPRKTTVTVEHHDPLDTLMRHMKGVK